MRRIDGRLKAIEKSISGDVNLRGIIGRYYDELTEEEQKAWFRYRYDGGHDIRVMEEMERYFNDGSLHFVCDRKPKPPTDEEIKERAEEIEQFLQARREEYNKGGKDGLFYNSV